MRGGGPLGLSVTIVTGSEKIILLFVILGRLRDSWTRYCLLNC